MGVQKYRLTGITRRNDRSGAIVVVRLGASHGKEIGVAPQLATLDGGIETVVGCGDVQHASDAGWQLGVEVTVAVCRVGKVVINVVVGSGDPDGDVVAG
jgi:hypothetical protein